MIVIINYGVGNLSSILNMFRYLKIDAMISSKFDDIEKADKLVLPGVGAFDEGMKNLHNMNLISILNKKVLEEKTLILGICLGMQLFTKKSEEGQMHGLGWIDAETIKFKFNGDHSNLKIPHMGWNRVLINDYTSIYKNMKDNDVRFYFVHSYHVVCHNNNNILSTTRYGYDFASSIQKDNIFGVQFHPEKSHKFGMILFKNFAEMT